MSGFFTPVRLAGLCALTLLTLGGCPSNGLFGLGNGFVIDLPEDVWVMGGNEARIVVVRDDSMPDSINLLDLVTSGDFSDFDPNLITWSLDVAVVDRDTLEVTHRFDDLMIDGGWNSVTDGRWIAWAGYDEDGVTVFDIDTEAYFSYLTIDGSAGNLNPIAIDDGRLLVSAWSAGSESVLFAVDLTTGDEQIVADGDLGYSFAISGDRVVGEVFPDFDPNVDTLSELFEGSELVLWDLATGERQTIVEDLSWVDDLWLSDDYVVWTTEDVETYDTLVRRCNLETGALETLMTLEYPEEFLDYTEIVGAGPAGVVYRNSRVAGVLSVLLPGGQMSEEYILRDYNGSERVLYSYSGPVRDFDACGSWPTLLDDALVYNDPGDCQVQIMDLETGTTRTFNAFE